MLATALLGGDIVVTFQENFKVLDRCIFQSITRAYLEISPYRRVEAVSF